MVTYILLGTILVLITFVVLLVLRDRKNTKRLEDQKKEFESKRAEIRQDAKKRSGAVQWGNSIENLVPFMDVFPVPVEDVSFLGKPVDLIAFTDLKSKNKCAVHIIEVKSGSAFLNTHQKNIKHAIEQNRVHWHEVRVEGNSMK